LERAKYWLEKATRAEKFEIRLKNQPALAGVIVNLATRVYWSRHVLCRSRFEEKPSHPPKKKKTKKRKALTLLQNNVKKAEGHGADLQLTTRVSSLHHGPYRSRFEERPRHAYKKQQRTKRKSMALLQKAVKKAEGHGTDSQRAEHLCEEEQKDNRQYTWLPQLETAARIVTYWKERRLLFQLQGGTMNSYCFGKHCTI